jgi:NAD(P)-dependent dehydrogenase (short-subunit alcohol dehydrogenase family)
MLLSAKTAIVTGASSGIGREIALTFAREGALVVAADVTEDVVEGGPPVIEALSSIDPRAHFVRTDVSDAASVEALVAETARLSDRIDILINDAAVSNGLMLHETSEVDWDRVIGVNLKGAFLCARAVVRRMLQQEVVAEARGRIVNLSSQHGMVASPGNFTYAVSKAGVAHMTRQIAADYGPQQIVCNAVAPGKILTGKIGRAIDPAVLDYSRRRTPLPRLGKPSDVAAAALWLASDEARFITGINLMVDGGWMAS